MADTKPAEEAVMDLIKQDPTAALSFITGAFVSLTLALLEREGLDPTKQVRIDSQGKRDITIHAQGDHG